jgi:hypothetical protein
MSEGRPAGTRNTNSAHFILGRRGFECDSAGKKRSDVATRVTDGLDATSLEAS